MSLGLLCLSVAPWKELIIVWWMIRDTMLEHLSH